MNEVPVNITGNIPESTMGRLGESVADLISPITELTGLIGDSLRTHREKMAERRITAVKEKAQKLGVETKKVPYKFIMGWLEGATIENEDSALNDLWENLLLAGMTNYQTYLEMFASILRELGGSEVNVLKQISQRHGLLDTGSGLVPALSNDDRMPENYAEIAKTDDEGHEIWSRMLDFHDVENRTGPFLVGAIFSENNGQIYLYHQTYQNNDVAFELLVRERLISINKASANAFSNRQGIHADRSVEVVIARLTQLGVSFSRACMFPERYLKRNED